ncbi:MAG: hypothetical protein U9O82_06895 [Thermodesulfobacteriota bacterium]|nr:hypothetical protein [Thermodesulfobacteriota bacterium]
MPVIDNFKIPDEITTELAGLVDHIPAEPLFSYLKLHKTVTKGFRPTKANLETIRQRIRESVSGSLKLDPHLRELLASAGINQEFTIVLSKTALALFFYEFMAIFGRVVFLASLLVDERKDVRRLAIHFLRHEPKGTVRVEPDIDQCLFEIRDNFGPFLKHMTRFIEGGIEQEGVSQEFAENSAEIKKLKTKILSLEKIIQASNTRSGLEKKLQKKLDRALEQHSELKKKFKNEKQERKEVAHEFDKAVRRADKLQEELKHSIRKGIRKEMTSIVRGWLAGPEITEQEAGKAVRHNESNDLLARVETTLDKQAEIDRHSGNLRTLSQRREDLIEVKKKIAKARAEAFNPLPVLKSLARELESEIDRLGRLLDLDREETQLSFIMQTRINEASSREEIEKIRRVIYDIDAIKVIRDDELKRLYRCYHKKLERMYDKYAPQTRENRETDDPSWMVKKAVSSDRELLLILDGHNILFNLPDIFGKYFDKGIPGRNAREKLVGTVVSCLRGAPNCKVKIFFDGPEHSETARSDNVKEIYSGGGEKINPDRADHAIIDYLDRGCEKKPARPKIVVTNDADLGKKAAEFGSAIIPLQQFGVLLDEMKQLL